MTEVAMTRDEAVDCGISGKTIAELGENCRKMGFDPEKLTPEFTQFDEGIGFCFVRFERDGSKVYVARREGLLKNMSEFRAEAKVYRAMLEAAR